MWINIRIGCRWIRRSPPIDGIFVEVLKKLMRREPIFDRSPILLRQG